MARNAAAVNPLSSDLLARLACPACRGSLAPDAETIRCSQCQRCYPIQDGIPVLIVDRAASSGPQNR